MLKKLQQKWKVTHLDLLLILITFAAGGSLCGFASRKIINFTGIDKGLVWAIVYMLLLTITWPFCVLLVSLVTGQFAFFKKYIAKIGRRFSTGKSLAATEEKPLVAAHSSITIQNPEIAKPEDICNIAIFASGAGSNALRLIEHFKNSRQAKIRLIVCNKPQAGVLDIATQAGIDTLLIERERFFNGDAYVAILKSHDIDLIVLAGFLWKVPPTLLQHFTGAVVNIHPALLPKYGGKGMYGARVHQAVIANEEAESGITIHLVDEVYDHGATIFQAFCKVEKADTADSLAAKVHQLEHQHYPRVVEEMVNAKYSLNKPVLPQN
jgi:formyltetrahydrofolate-dependent phosphoribosylglycinamide formyltransferase